MDDEALSKSGVTGGESVPKTCKMTVIDPLPSFFLFCLLLGFNSPFPSFLSFFIFFSSDIVVPSNEHLQLRYVFVYAVRGPRRVSPAAAGPLRRAWQQHRFLFVMAGYFIMLLLVSLWRDRRFWRWLGSILPAAADSQR